PHRVHRLAIADAQRVIDGIALVGAVGRVLRALEIFELGVLARDVEHRPQRRLLERERTARIRHHTAVEAHAHVVRVRLDGYGMVGSGNLHRSSVLGRASVVTPRACPRKVMGALRRPHSRTPNGRSQDDPAAAALSPCGSGCAAGAARRARRARSRPSTNTPTISATNTWPTYCCAK